MGNAKKAVLITGASSGIGKEIASKLAQEGYQVFAGIRKKSDKFKLEKISKNITGVYLDVTNQAGIDKAFWYVLKKTDSLYALINNAGIAVGGPMEFLPVKKIKEQFDINVFGAVAVAQKFLPILNDGRIINMSSMASTGIFPFTAPYCASKRALDILFNSLQIELNQSNIKVISIKPGVIKTPIWDKSIRSAQLVLKDLPEGCSEKYKRELNAMERSAFSANDKGIEPMAVANTISKALKAKNPKLSYSVGIDAFWVLQFAKLPQNIINFFVQKCLKARAHN
ncbi:MAG: SDR family oxidoreductase [Candidatus Gastranaerophilales bacterium]|nr:SDR family oxidoreductase [Candidatus Gastranaerophilales bacterium]